MKNIKIIAGTVVLLLFVSCKKNELGGSSVIRGKVMHHSKLIGQARVFIKFDAKEFPGGDTGVYDAKVSCNALAEYSINCYKGDYFLYAVGTDPALPSPSVVVGGAPAKLRKNEELEVNLAVTEGD